MAPRDAQMYWMSAKIPNDQFLLFCFTEPLEQPDAVRAFVARRAARIADLRVRALDVPAHLDYPYWVPRDEAQVPVVVHASAGLTWHECRGEIAKLLTAAVDIRVCPWRLHLFPAVAGAPRTGSAQASVAVLQVSHALADGRRASAAARALFGPGEPPVQAVPALPTHPAARGLARFPGRLARLAGVSRDGYRAYRRQQELVEAGDLDAESEGFPLISLNCRPDDRREIRMIVTERDKLRAAGVSVTAGVLTAVGTALSRYLRDHGQCVPERMGAELTVADPGEPKARNHFRNLGIDLCHDEPNPRARALRIAGDIERRRRRAAHPVFVAQRAGASALPAPLMWAGVNAFSLDVLPPTMMGNTVVSSVARGEADLSLGGGPVAFTAGFPALSPAMGLTHGVHGIGDTVTVSVHSSAAVMPDVDHYEQLLTDALAEVCHDEFHGPRR